MNEVIIQKSILRNLHLKMGVVIVAGVPIALKLNDAISGQEEP